MADKQHLVRFESGHANVVTLAVACVVILSLGGCVSYRHHETVHEGPTLFSVASFDSTVSGVAATSAGRIFVSLPDLWTRPEYAVLEVTNGARKPYPDTSWNCWRNGSDSPVERSWVGVTSICIDPNGHKLWVLDSGSIGWSGKCIAGATKLVEIDLALDRVTKVYSLRDAVTKGSTLNDVRIDPVSGWAVISDSGLGRLIVVNLSSGEVAARLVESGATKAHKGYVVKVGGQPWRALFGVEPKVHVNGIAVDYFKRHVYFHALTAPTLYRVPLDSLIDPNVSEAELEDMVFAVAHTGATDGMAIGPDGHLYWTALEADAIERLSPAGRDVVVRDKQIQWPDNLVLVRDRGGKVFLYFTIAMMHLEWPFNWFRTVTDQPYQLFRVAVPDVSVGIRRHKFGSRLPIASNKIGRDAHQTITSKAHH